MTTKNKYKDINLNKTTKYMVLISDERSSKFNDHDQPIKIRLKSVNQTDHNPITTFPWTSPAGTNDKTKLKDYLTMYFLT